MKEVVPRLPAELVKRLITTVNDKMHEARRVGISQPYLNSETAGLSLTGANSICSVNPAHGAKDNLWLWWSRVKKPGVRLTLNTKTWTCSLATREITAHEVEQLIGEMAAMAVAIESQTVFGHIEQGRCIALIDDTRLADAEPTSTPDRASLGYEPHLYLGSGQQMPPIFREQNPAKFFHEFWKLVARKKIVRVPVSQLGDNAEFLGKDERLELHVSTKSPLFASASPYIEWDIQHNRAEVGTLYFLLGPAVKAFSSSTA